MRKRMVVIKHEVRRRPESMCFPEVIRRYDGDVFEEAKAEAQSMAGAGAGWHWELSSPPERTEPSTGLGVVWQLMHPDGGVPNGQSGWSVHWFEAAS